MILARNIDFAGGDIIISPLGIQASIQTLVSEGLKVKSLISIRNLKESKIRNHKGPQGTLGIQRNLRET